MDLSIEKWISNDIYATYLVPEKHRRYITVEDADLPDRATTVNISYIGNRADEFTYLELDIGEMPSGIHKLNLIVKDLNTDQTVERSALFRIVE